MQTRYYDPETGRFISPDTVDYLDPETVHGLNLYAYCNNNPVMNVDPTGHFWKEIGDFLSSFFNELKFITDNAIDSLYCNAGIGWGFGVGIEISSLVELELMATQGVGVEMFPVPQVGRFEKMLGSLKFFEVTGPSYGIDGFTSIGEQYNSNGQAIIQDVTVGIGASAFFMLGGYWDIGFNVSKFSRLMGW